MRSRRLAALALSSVLCLSVASATSLGTFDDVALTGQVESHDACTATADLLDPLGNVISLGGVLPSVQVDAVALSAIDGDCAGMVPVVVTIDGSDEVLDVLDFTGRAVLDGTETTVTLDVLSTDPLSSLLGLTVSVSEVRVAFCPVGSTCT